MPDGRQLIFGSSEPALKLIVLTTQRRDDLNGAINALLEVGEGVDSFLNCFHLRKEDYRLLNVRLGRGFRFFDKREESGGIVHRDVGKNLAVQFNTRALQTIDEFAVRDFGSAASGIDAHDPQRPEIALLQPAADVSLAQRFLDSFLGCPIQLAFGKKITGR